MRRSWIWGYSCNAENRLLFYLTIRLRSKGMREKGFRGKSGSCSWCAYKRECIQFNDIKINHSLIEEKMKTGVQETEVRHKRREEFESQSGRERGKREGRESRKIRYWGRGKQRICPGTPENNSAGVKIIYGSHLRGCSVIVCPSLI